MLEKRLWPMVLCLIFACGATIHLGFAVATLFTEPNIIWIVCAALVFIVAVAVFYWSFRFEYK